MQRVLELPNTKIAMIVGSKDKVVTPKQVYQFMDGFANKTEVPIIELDGLGHDAFEEDVETFCETVDQLLALHWKVSSE
jgi:hypothetical protein